MNTQSYFQLKFPHENYAATKDGTKVINIKRGTEVKAKGKGYGFILGQQIYVSKHDLPLLQTDIEIKVDAKPAIATTAIATPVAQPKIDTPVTIKQNRSLDNPERYQQLPKPYDGYAFDTLNKELYSLITSQSNGSFYQMSTLKQQSYKAWVVTTSLPDRPTRKISLMQIEAMIRSGSTTTYTNPKTDADSYWIVMNSETGVVSSTKHKDVLDASNEAKVESDATGIDFLIFKLVGRATIERTAKVRKIA